MGLRTKTRKWLRRSFPGVYKKFGRYLHARYPLMRRIVNHAMQFPELYADPQIAVALEGLSNGDISVFSFPGHEKYNAIPVKVRVDDNGFPWVNHKGKRLYFRHGISPERVVRSYRALLSEQDPASPHCYSAGGGLREGDVLLDVGSAEGIYALDNVEAAALVVLFEVDPAWVGALEKTFAPWRDKVAIINRSASDADNAESVTIDTVMREMGFAGSVLLKLDVEGAEEKVLRGASEMLSRPDTRAVVCTYHSHDDHERLSSVMRAAGYNVETSGGWMLFLHDRNLQPPFFRHGLIYCCK